MKRVIERIRIWTLALLMVAALGGGVTAVATPNTAGAACSPPRLLTFPAWYKGLQDPNDCRSLKSPGDVGLSKYIWTIVFNIIEILLQLVGYLCVAFIIFAGFRFMVSSDSPDGMTKARKTLLNAVIGLVISIASVAIVNLIAGAIVTQ